MTRLLSLFGLMRVSEHKKVVQEEILQSIKAANRASDEKGFRFKAEKRADELEAKFKRAVADLAAQAEEIAGLKQHVMSITRDRNSWREEANTLRPDAEAMRNKRAADRKRMAGKRNG